jgi:hypothetical protein
MPHVKHGQGLALPVADTWTLSPRISDRTVEGSEAENFLSYNNVCVHSFKSRIQFFFQAMEDMQVRSVSRRGA